MSSPTGREPSEPELQTLEPRTAFGTAIRHAFFEKHRVEMPVRDLAELEVRVLAQLGAVDWQISRHCNLWVKLPSATLTVFRDKKQPGYRGCITRSAKEGPIFGEMLHADVESAKHALLLKYISMGGELEETVEHTSSTNVEDRHGKE